MNIMNIYIMNHIDKSRLRGIYSTQRKNYPIKIIIYLKTCFYGITIIPHHPSLSNKHITIYKVKYRIINFLCC